MQLVSDLLLSHKKIKLKDFFQNIFGKLGYSIRKMKNERQINDLANRNLNYLEMN